jgi:glycosyltransferase involved in cell wall biosynthesis
MPVCRTPRVSIGLPVYNGEKFIGPTLDAIVAQTYSDFELIISDNASSDHTAEICQDYAARDRRLRYVRQAHNLGAIPNFNHAFALASGEFFRWAAYDDLIAPEFLARGVAALDAAPEATLCASLVRYIDATGANLGIYDSHLLGADAAQPSARFATMTFQPHPGNDLYGLIRRRALVGSAPLGSFHGADRALLAALALRGPFIRLREPLLLIREHPERYTRLNTRPRDRLTWHDTRQTGRLYLPTLRLYAEYWRCISGSGITRSERWRCYLHLLRWWGYNWNWARLAVDLCAPILPDIVTYAEAFKQKVFSPRPGVLTNHKSDSSGSP